MKNKITVKFIVCKNKLSLQNLMTTSTEETNIINSADISLEEPIKTSSNKSKIREIMKN